MVKVDVLPQVKVMDEARHYPVMCGQVLELLDVHSSAVVVDCTVGTGAHAKAFLEVMPANGVLIGIDKDGDSLAVADQRLKPFAGKYRLIQSDFAHMDEALKGAAVRGVDVFFFDLGISTYQLNVSERGFSFLKEGPLDMRMNRDAFISARSHTGSTFG